ncbi:hypothetical protein ALO_11699 [Acetonema longum DSM 6540]|uniref:Uncharacterized protein n=1 Tax=Acetonema longum DSM 6540 TaxID=1009370 RepID=F7NJT2_9FIRM|nr:hypothetical protein ALO_11699 [Acetonema longum DSM 6540]
MAKSRLYKIVSRETFACIGILAEPVIWDGVEVRIFLVSIGSKSNKTCKNPC